MNTNLDAQQDAAAALTAAALPSDDAKAWGLAFPALRADFAADSAQCTAYWALSRRLRERLPRKPERNAPEAAAAALVHARERELREQFLALHAEGLYARLTADRTRFLRVDALLAEAARLVPGLAPDAKALEIERELPLKDKDGIEIDQGILLGSVLAHPEAGRHLCQAMLLPLPESAELLARLVKDGSVDLGKAWVGRAGKASLVELRNPRYLNAQDDSIIRPLETAIDLAILDPGTEIAVLRGGLVEHPKYAGRRIYCSGLNLTQLYLGKLSFLFYFHHAMGYEHKVHRGLARPDASLDDLARGTIEKPWISVVETFAIGGGCQHLLTMDYVLAEAGAYLTLPARKEGIIPGLANLRLPRFVGDRLARQAIMYGREFACDSPEGRMICDEVVPAGEMDAALGKLIEGLTSSGIVSFVGNRRQFRLGQEPIDLYRRYMALYAKEQAYCHFSGGLISNLERHWNAQQRKL
jgi:thioesterase DpgC